MKFKDKIVVLRKKNNLSQEALAEKLNMSRQAISKWESGNSYPDMNTMLKVCDILNCTLDELLDDNVLGSNSFEKQNKVNINKWIKEILDFITKLYNMFFSMKFKDKIKFIIEMIFIFLLLFGISILIYEILLNILYDLFYVLPYDFYSIITNFLDVIYFSFSIIFGGIIFIHLLKIRYLDYYVTVEDIDVNNKQLEKEVDTDVNNKQLEKVVDKKEYKYIEKKREKIIIRDPKHTTYSFFSGLGKIMLFLIKIFILIILLPFIISFILFCISGTISIIWIKYGVLFLGIFVFSIGALLINYDILELGIKFLFNKTNNFKKMFIIFIIGLFISGIGCGISLSQVNQFKFVDNRDYYKNKNIEIIMEDNIILYEFDKDLIEIDNSVDNIIYNIDYLDYMDVNIESYDNYYYKHKYVNVYGIGYSLDNINFIDMILNDLKNKEIREYDNQVYKINKIILNEDNYNRILKNNNEYFGYESD